MSGLQLSISEVGTDVGRVMLTIGYLGPLEGITSVYSPVSTGVTNEGFVIPQQHLLKSTRSRALSTFYTMANLKSFNRFMTLLGVMKKSGIVMSSMTFSYLHEILDEYEIPLHFFQFPTVVLGDPRAPPSLEMSTLNELLQRYNLSTLNQALNFICQTAVFGFPLTQQVIEYFDMGDTIADYVKLRLFQGSWDSLIAGPMIATKNFTSIFLGDEQFDLKHSELVMNELRKMNLNNATEITRLQSQLGKVQFLGGATPYIQALANRNKIKTSPEYKKYLSNTNVLGSRISEVLFHLLSNQNIEFSTRLGKTGVESTNIDKRTIP